MNFKRKIDPYRSAKGNTFIIPSIPYINEFNFKARTISSKPSWGFLGVGLSAAYCNTDNSYVGVVGKLALNLPAHLGVPIDHAGGGKNELLLIA